MTRLYGRPPDDEAMRLPESHMGYGGHGYVLSCAICRRCFRARYPLSRYCSERCRNDAYIERRRERRGAARQKVCEVCEKPFTAARSDAKTCSAACRQKAYRRRVRV